MTSAPRAQRATSAGSSLSAAARRRLDRATTSAMPSAAAPKITAESAPTCFVISLSAGYEIEPVVGLQRDVVSHPVRVPLRQGRQRRFAPAGGQHHLVGEGLAEEVVLAATA